MSALVTLWKTVDDSNVMTVWKDFCGNEHFVSPAALCEGGIPFDPENDDYMEYVRTEVKVEYIENHTVLV